MNPKLINSSKFHSDNTMRDIIRCDHGNRIIRRAGNIIHILDNNLKLKSSIKTSG